MRQNNGEIMAILFPVHYHSLNLMAGAYAAELHSLNHEIVNRLNGR